MRCAVSFWTVIFSSIAVGVMALYIIWATKNNDNCGERDFRCLTSGKCIKTKDACNDQQHCPDKSDESPIYCRDFTTTQEKLEIFPECAARLPILVDMERDKYRKANQSHWKDMKFDVEEIPNGCVPNLEPTLPPRGIFCGNMQWKQIPWEELDRNARILSIKNKSLNTNVLLGQNETIGKDFPLLDKVYIDNNSIQRVGDRVFCRMEYICLLSLTNNSIMDLSSEAFCLMESLLMLKMSMNRLHLKGFQFLNLPLLRGLDLEQNEIEEIAEYTFHDVENLQFLNLSNNKIQRIHEKAFQNNVKLIELDLTGNKLHHVAVTIFTKQMNLTKLYMSKNPWKFLPAQLFEPLKNLLSLKIDDVDISQVDVNAFKMTPKLDLIYFKKFSYCRFVPMARRCYPNSDGLSSTINLLIGHSRVMVWFVGIVTLLGNIFVLANRWSRARQNRNKILNIFVSNLAGADLLMGVYLLILACKDVEYRGLYSVKAYAWSTSWLCSGIGIIAMVSSEVSLLILTIMSFERYLVIGGLFSQRQNLNTNLARACMLVIWIFAGILAIAPAIQWRGNSAFYGSTGLCFPLHLDEKFPVGWQYTTFVFIGVNTCCLLVITISYSMLFYTVKKTRDKTPILVKNIELAFRFFLMVVTDVLCWAPIILLKIIVLYGYDIPKEIIGWAVIYALPLNSAVNPILYTFSTDEARNTIAAHFSKLLPAVGISDHFTSRNNAASIELESVEHGCQSKVKPATVTDDTELANSQGLKSPLMDVHSKIMITPILINGLDMKEKPKPN